MAIDGAELFSTKIINASNHIMPLTDMLSVHMSIQLSSTISSLSLSYTAITLLVIIILCVRYKKRHNRSWSPQKSFKMNGNGDAVDPTSMKPVHNGNGIMTTLSKDEEAELELNHTNGKPCENVYVDQV